jgi:hypothetical protein
MHEHVWEGRVTLQGEFEVKMDGVLFSPTASQRVWNHSPDGFNWGYHGSGPAQLALAILLVMTTPEEAQIRHQDFKRAFVATWPHQPGDHWSLSSAIVRMWLQSDRIEHPSPWEGLSDGN